MVAAEPQADGQQKKASGRAGNWVGSSRGNLGGEVSLGRVRQGERRKPGPGAEAHDRRAKPHQPVPGKRAVPGKEAAIKPQLPDRQSGEKICAAKHTPAELQREWTDRTPAPW